LSPDWSKQEVSVFALSVVGHPSTHSFSHAMAARASTTLELLGIEVAHHDLYEEGFEPVSGGDELVALHREQLAAADLILVFHPNWWGMPPAILKGWVDRVFVPHVAYRDAPIGFPPLGLLTATAALVFNTGDTPPEREAAVFGDPLQKLWVAQILGFCGVDNVVRRLYSPASSSTDEQREIWLEEVDALVAAATE
jgi:putative NADPH-quinone reductase